jgi:thiamine biosynthesis lipoprotein
VSIPQALMPVSTTFRAIGTTVSVLTVGPEALGAAAALLRLQLEQLDEACSRFRPGSELSLAHRSGGKPVVVSGLLAELVQASLDVARLTDGAVDPTVGNAVICLGYLCSRRISAQSSTLITLLSPWSAYDQGLGP